MKQKEKKEGASMRAEKVRPRFKENILETLDVREMIGKYLAEPVYKEYVDDFVEGGEVVSVSRKELLFKAGTFVDPVLSSKISFMIQSGEIENPVKVTDLERRGEFVDSSILYAPMMVKFNNGLKSIWCLVWANGLSNAITVASDYLEQIQSLQFSVSEVKFLGADLIDREEFYRTQEEASEQMDIVLNPLVFYTVDVIYKEAGCPVPFIRPSKQGKEFLRYASYVCMANNLDEAKEIVGEEVSRIAKVGPGWNDVEICFVKGKPFSASIIVPKWFCDSYRFYYKLTSQIS